MPLTLTFIMKCDNIVQGYEEFNYITTCLMSVVNPYTYELIIFCIYNINYCHVAKCLELCKGHVYKGSEHSMASHVRYMNQHDTVRSKILERENLV